MTKCLTGSALGYQEDIHPGNRSPARFDQNSQYFPAPNLVPERCQGGSSVKSYPLLGLH